MFQRRDSRTGQATQARLSEFQRRLGGGPASQQAQHGERYDPAPQGFLGHLIAREFSQEECRDGEARSGIGGGGSP